MTKSDLTSLQFLLSAMPVKGLELEKILKVVAMIKEVREKEKAYVMAREKIFNSYGITIGLPDSDMKYHGHPQYDKINKLIVELDESTLELDVTNFLSQDELLKIFKDYEGLKAGGILLLQEALLKNE